MPRLPYAPRHLPQPFSLRDLEQHITQYASIGTGYSTVRAAENALREWIRTGRVIRARRTCPKYGVPLFNACERSHSARKSA